jgi:hypothetical protein
MSTRAAKSDDEPGTKQAAESAPAISGGAGLQQDKMAAGEDPATLGGAGLQQEEMAAGEDPATLGGAGLQQVKKSWTMASAMAEFERELDAICDDGGASSSEGKHNECSNKPPATQFPLGDMGPVECETDETYRELPLPNGGGNQITKSTNQTIAVALAEFDDENDETSKEKNGERGNGPPATIIPLGRGTGLGENHQEKTYRASAPPNGRGEQGTKDELELWVEDPRTASRDEGTYRASSPPNGRGEQGTKNEQTGVDAANYEERLLPPSGDDGKHNMSERIGCESIESETGSDESASSSDEDPEPEVLPRDHWTNEALDIHPDQRYLMNDEETGEVADHWSTETDPNLEDKGCRLMDACLALALEMEADETHVDRWGEISRLRDGLRVDAGETAIHALSMRYREENQLAMAHIREVLRLYQLWRALHGLRIWRSNLIDPANADQQDKHERTVQELSKWALSRSLFNDDDITCAQLQQDYERRLAAIAEARQLYPEGPEDWITADMARRSLPSDLFEQEPGLYKEKTTTTTTAQEMTVATPLKQEIETTATTTTPQLEMTAVTPLKQVATPQKKQNSPVFTPEKYEVRLRLHDGCGKMTNTPATGMGNMLASAGTADSGRPSGRPPDT